MMQYINFALSTHICACQVLLMIISLFSSTSNSKYQQSILEHLNIYNEILVNLNISSEFCRVLTFFQVTILWQLNILVHQFQTVISFKCVNFEHLKLLTELLDSTFHVFGLLFWQVKRIHHFQTQKHILYCNFKVLKLYLVHHFGVLKIFSDSFQGSKTF